MSNAVTNFSQSPKANKMDDDDERMSPSRLESKKSSVSTTVESDSQDGDCSTCPRSVEHSVTQVNTEYIYIYIYINLRRS